MSANIKNNLVDVDSIELRSVKCDKTDVFK